MLDHPPFHSNDFLKFLLLVILAYFILVVQKRMFLLNHAICTENLQMSIIILN